MEIKTFRYGCRGLCHGVKQFFENPEDDCALLVYKYWIKCKKHWRYEVISMNAFALYSLSNNNIITEVKYKKR